MTTQEKLIQRKLSVLPCFRSSLATRTWPRAGSAKRHGLETFKQRLKRLEAKAAEAGWVYTEAQLAALEKAKQEREGEPDAIETQHPGYLAAQDTMYVGYLKHKAPNSGLRITMGNCAVLFSALTQLRPAPSPVRFSHLCRRTPWRSHPRRLPLATGRRPASALSRTERF